MLGHGPDMKKPPPDVPFRTITLRMPTAMHEQLRELAFNERTSQHALVLEGINLMFRQHGHPTIADSGAVRGAS
jgi:hypothetical protein